MKKGFSLKSIIIAGVSLFTILGAFLPWATIDAILVKKSYSGLGGESGVADGIFFVIGGILVIAFAAIFLKKEMALWCKITISALSALLIVLAFQKIIDFNSVPLTSVGFGLILLVVSNIAAGVLPWIPIKVYLGGDKTPAAPAGPAPQQTPPFGA